jgi:hypothetical protein
MYVSAGVWGVATALPVVELRIQCHYFSDAPCISVSSSWMRMFQTNLLEKITQFLCQELSPENHAFYEVIWKNMVVPDRSHTGDNAIRRIHFVSWIIKTTDTHSEYVISMSFPQRQLLHKCAWMYIAYLVCLYAYLFVCVCVCVCVFAIDEKDVNKTHFYNCSRLLNITTGRFRLLPK